MLTGMDSDCHKDSAAAVKHHNADIYSNSDKDHHGNIYAHCDTHGYKYSDAKYGHSYNYEFVHIHEHGDPDFDGNKLFHASVDID